jgi:hypothetical protein
MMGFVYDDGGRHRAGFKGMAGDCVCRSIAIAAQLPYVEVYKALGQRMKTHEKISSARDGVHTSRKWFKDYMRSLGFVWVPTMLIGKGCRVHLREDELPHGRLVVSVSKHFTAVINGVIFDTHDPSRGGTRCVYGYWIKERMKP